MDAEEREAVLGVLGARQWSPVERLVALASVLLLERDDYTREVSNHEVADVLGLDADAVADALEAMSGEDAPFSMRREAAE